MPHVEPCRLPPEAAKHVSLGVAPIEVMQDPARYRMVLGFGLETTIGQIHARMIRLFGPHLHDDQVTLRRSAGSTGSKPAAWKLSA